MPTEPERARDLRSVTAAHTRLLDQLRHWVASDPDPSVPSRLPGWTVGHVITHLARNADSFVRIIDGAANGLVLEQYENGPIGRERDIELGAGRRAEELLADLTESIDRLERRFAATDWVGAGRSTLGATLELAELPTRRRREVEVHHVDLGLGYEPEDWPAEFVRPELRRQEMTAKSRMPMGMTTWPIEVLGLSPNRRLAWLFGRVAEPGLPEPGAWS